MAHVLTALIAVLIAVTTLAPEMPGPRGVAGIDKLWHLLAFAALAVPLAWRFPHHWRRVALAALAYGGAIELVQPVIGREAEWGDFLADGLGAVAGARLGAWLGRVWRDLA